MINAQFQLFLDSTWKVKLHVGLGPTCTEHAQSIRGAGHRCGDRAQYTIAWAGGVVRDYN